VEIVRTNRADRGGRCERNDQGTHSTLPGFMIPFGSSAALQFVHDGEFHRIGAARELGCLQAGPMPCSALCCRPGLSTRSNRASSSAGPRAMKLSTSAPGFGSH